MCSYAAPGLPIQVYKAMSDPDVKHHGCHDEVTNQSVAAGRFLEQDVQVFEETMNLNYFGTLRVLKAFLPGMVRRGEGEVVLVSSAAAVCGTICTARPFQDAAWYHLRTAAC